MTYLDPENSSDLEGRATSTAGPTPPSPRRLAKPSPPSTTATAHSADVARRFANDETFHAIRLEPYLEATARRHDDLAEELCALSQRRSGEARPGARRRQSEEHPRRPGRTCAARCRVRLVRRAGLRPGLLPQPPAPQMRLEAGSTRRSISPASMPCRPPTSPACAGKRPRAWRRGRRGFCQRCSWAASMGSRPSSTSRRTSIGSASDGQLAT